MLGTSLPADQLATRQSRASSCPSSPIISHPRPFHTSSVSHELDTFTARQNRILPHRCCDQSATTLTTAAQPSYAPSRIQACGSIFRQRAGVTTSLRERISAPSASLLFAAAWKRSIYHTSNRCVTQANRWQPCLPPSLTSRTSKRSRMCPTTTPEHGLT